MERFKELESYDVFKFFSEISQIPRESKKETLISNYLKEFAEERGLEIIQDESLNIIIKKPATSGYENFPTVILQSHMDMVCEKKEGSNHNFDKDPIEWVIKDDLIYANDTTLGADNGIGLAYSLAILDSKDLKHPAIEAVITSDEETGMTGAKSIDTDLLEGKIFINIDSEEEGQFFLSCAGGNTMNIKLPVAREEVSGLAIEINVEDLLGGHSGMEINKERINANKLNGRILNRLFDKKIKFNIFDISGGSKSNVITPSAQLGLVIDKNDYNLVAEEISYLNESIKAEYHSSDPNAQISLVKQEEGTKSSLNKEDSLKVMKLLVLLPYGPLHYSTQFDDLVQTSANIGSVDLNDSKLGIVLSLRSSVESQKQEVIEKCNLIASLVDAEITSSDFYPGWPYDENSRIKDLFADNYQKLFNDEGEITAIHAGLECGLFKEKMENNVDFISFGPNMWEVHSPQEHVSISSIDRNYKLLVAVLEDIGGY